MSRLHPVLLMFCCALAQAQNASQPGFAREFEALQKLQDQCVQKKLDSCAKLPGAIAAVRGAPDMTPQRQQDFLDYELQARRAYGLRLRESRQQDKALEQFGLGVAELGKQFDGGKRAWVVIDNYPFITDAAKQYVMAKAYAQADELFGLLRASSERAYEPLKSGKGREGALSTLVLYSESAAHEWALSLSDRSAAARLKGQTQQADSLGREAVANFDKGAQWATIAEASKFTLFAQNHPRTRMAGYALARGDELMQLKQFGDAEKAYTQAGKYAVSMQPDIPNYKEDMSQYRDRQIHNGLLVLSLTGMARALEATGKKPLALEAMKEAEAVYSATPLKYFEEMNYVQARMLHAHATLGSKTWTQVRAAWVLAKQWPGYRAADDLLVDKLN